MNENCLEGVRCPECGQEDSFWIEARALCKVFDDGIEESQDFEWDENSFCMCSNSNCKFIAKVKDFQIQGG